MARLKNRRVQSFIVIGFLLGLLLLLLGIFLEFTKRHLPFGLESLLHIHGTDPMIFMLDLGPIFFAIMAGLIGLQYTLSVTFARGKREWEAIFDSLSDLIIIIDTQGRILRCNHAFSDCLNTTFSNILEDFAFHVSKDTHKKAKPENPTDAWSRVYTRYQTRKK